MPASKLKPEDVEQIVDGANVFELASRFGVSASVIWDWGRRRGVKLESQDRSYASLDYSIPGAVLARRLGLSRQRVGQLKARWGTGVVSCSIGFWEREEALALGLVAHGVAVEDLAPELRRHILEPGDSCIGLVKADVGVSSVEGCSGSGETDLDSSRGEIAVFSSGGVPVVWDGISRVGPTVELPDGHFSDVAVGIEVTVPMPQAPEVLPVCEMVDYEIENSADVWGW